MAKYEERGTRNRSVAGVRSTLLDEPGYGATAIGAQPSVVASWREHYANWTLAISAGQVGRPLWTVSAYRLSLFLVRVSWSDVNRMHRHRLTTSAAGQLYRSIGAIGADVSEGYSRRSPADRARFYEYALGSARESLHWYEVGLPVLGRSALRARREMLDEVAALLVAMIAQERRWRRSK